jgi:hypothetical protein
MKNCGFAIKMKENRKRKKPPRLAKMNCLSFAYAGTESIISKYRLRRICQWWAAILKNVSFNPTLAFIGCMVEA